ncbi:unnamed protein product [Closterium sp. NIES-53]
MIHAAAPNLLWPFAVRYGAHQLNLWPRVSLPETSPTQRWTEQVGDASMFRVWGSRAFVQNTSPDKLSSRAIPCVFLGFPPDTPGWQFYHPTSHRVFLRTSRPPRVDPIPPQGPAPSGVSQVDPLPGTAPVEVAGAGSGGAEPGGEEPGGAEPGGADPEGVEPGRAESEGAESRGAEPQGAASSGGPAGTGVTTGAGGIGGTAATGPGGARTMGTRATGTAGVAGAGAGDPTEPRPAGAGGFGAGGAGAGGVGAGGTGAGGTGAGVGDTGAGGGGARGAGAIGPRDTVRPRPLHLILSRLFALLLTFLVCVLGMHAMALRPSSVPLRVPLLAPPESYLLVDPEPESDRARATSPTVSRLLATAITDPSFETAVASVLVAELLVFAAACHLDYATALVAESASASPPSVGGECALGTHVLEDRQEDFECLAADVPRFASMLLAPEGDPDAPDIPTPLTYAEAITGPYSSQWQAAMDAEMASWKSTGIYVDEVPPPGANIVDGMWIFRVKPPSGSPPAFKARYVARGFSQRQGVDYFQTFSPTPKMTTLWVLLHDDAQRTQWSLCRTDYGLRQAPRGWHDTLRTTLAALGFAPSCAVPSLFLRTDTSLPPFYVLVYVDDLVFATTDTEALTLVKLELQKRHTCTDLGELRSYLGLQITRDRARRTITLTQSHMVHQVLLRFGFHFSLPRPTPLSTGHSLSAPPSDEFVEPIGPYPELVGCLMYLMTCTRPDLAYPLSLLARYVAPVHRAWGSCLEDGVQLSSVFTQTLFGLSTQLRNDLRRVTPSALLQQRGQLRLAYVATRANTVDIFTKALQSACFAFLDWSCVDLHVYTDRPSPGHVHSLARVEFTLLWHHHLGHPSLPRLRGMHSRLLVSSLLQSLPPLPPSPAPPSLPCFEGR